MNQTINQYINNELTK